MARVSKGKQVKRSVIMEDEEMKREQNANENEIEQCEHGVNENGELAQDFLNVRRSIQRMNHRRDAWTRR